MRAPRRAARRPPDSAAHLTAPCSTAQPSIPYAVRIRESVLYVVQRVAGKCIDVTGSDELLDCIDCTTGKYIDEARRD